MSIRRRIIGRGDEPETGDDLGSSGTRILVRALIVLACMPEHPMTSLKIRRAGDLTAAISPRLRLGRHIVADGYVRTACLLCRMLFPRLFCYQLLEPGRVTCSTLVHDGVSAPSGARRQEGLCVYTNREAVDVPDSVHPWDYPLPQSYWLSVPQPARLNPLRTPPIRERQHPLQPRREPRHRHHNRCRRMESRAQRRIRPHLLRRRHRRSHRSRNLAGGSRPTTPIAVSCRARCGRTEKRFPRGTQRMTPTAQK